MIGDNKAVSENRNLFFDEMIQYEIKGGDIYKEEPGEEETCIVLNGHVVQADFRCGYLWYISQYQIPNSSQVKTTIYRRCRTAEGRKRFIPQTAYLKQRAFRSRTTGFIIWRMRFCSEES